MSAFAPKADKKQTFTVCPLSANNRPRLIDVTIRRRSSQLRGGEAEHVATIDLDHGVEAGGVRLSHAPKSGFGHFNRPIFMEDEIQARIEYKPIDRRRRRNQGWRLWRFVSRA